MREAPPFEIDVVEPGRTAEFRRAHERDALSDAWGFRVVWHDQNHELAATADGRTVGALGLEIAASLARVALVAVAPDERRRGIGRALVARAETLANYYNCHKVTLEVWKDSAAQRFFEACGYKIEAILPQHTWKLDVAVMRKFLL